ncbi:hypothetical protein GMD78_06910 [Ornithinibacillus sp. L9]|uniref:YaaC n=1 Tax=Ornithinibacillus caprae TaxID=2678566 RepID=A0A6N8FEL4_9BACI|nr:YaaC family protein [Ornithinibacillus caprae]MUK88122.1 hypothetical protein [Ornithinibacillus caprae]
MNKKAIDTFFVYLQSQETAQVFLHNCYKQLNDVDAEKKSFENSGKFLYYLEEGGLFFSEAEKVDIRLRPILYFYGLVHMLKACLVTNRPDYPESTSILAHGVSARKRKRKDYSFLLDEVKIQQNGLFTYSSKHLFHLSNSPFTKIQMDILFGVVPEMNDFYVCQQQPKCISIGNLGLTTLYFPSTLLDSYYLTEKSFINRIRPYLPSIESVEKTNDVIEVHVKKPLVPANGPFYLHLDRNEIYFPIEREYFLKAPEVLIHYLLLYNLSMVSRYETEYWGELFSTKYDFDYASIHYYLTNVADKARYLLGNWLLDKKQSH